MKIRKVACLALAAAAGACGGGGGQNPFTGPPTPQAPRDPIEIRVENQNQQIATVKVVSRGQIHRLGEVQASKKGVFEVPISVSEFDLSVLVDLIGGAVYRSRNLTVSPGGHIDVFVASSLRHTTVTFANR